MGRLYNNFVKWRNLTTLYPIWFSSSSWLNLKTICVSIAGKLILNGPQSIMAPSSAWIVLPFTSHWIFILHLLEVCQWTPGASSISNIWLLVVTKISRIFYKTMISVMKVYSSAWTLEHLSIIDLILEASVKPSFLVTNNLLTISDVNRFLPMKFVPQNKLWHFNI